MLDVVAQPAIQLQSDKRSDTCLAFGRIFPFFMGRDPLAFCFDLLAGLASQTTLGDESLPDFVPARSWQNLSQVLSE
jgi:hypothetical protein